MKMKQKNIGMLKKTEEIESKKMDCSILIYVTSSPKKYFILKQEFILANSGTAKCC